MLGAGLGSRAPILGVHLASPPVLRVLLAAFLALGLAAQPPAQDPPKPAPATPQETVASLQARLDGLKNDATLTEEQRAPIVDALTRAIEHTRDGDAFAAQAAAALVEKDGAPARLAQVRQQIADLQAPPAPVVAEGAKVRDLEPRLAEAQLAWQTAQKDVNTLEQEADRRTVRRSQIPARLAEARKTLDGLPAAVPAEGVEPRLLEARRLRLAAERRLLTAEIAALENELLSYEARDELLVARRDLAARTAAAAKAQAEAWQTIVQERRAAEAAAEQAAAQAAAEQARRDHPLLAELASGNARIAAELPRVAEARLGIEKEAERARALLSELTSQYEDVKKRVQRAGSTQAIGSLLRQRRAQLPDATRTFRRSAREHESLSAQASLAALDWQDQRRAQVDDTGLLDRLVDNTPPLLDDPVERALLRDRARELLDKRLEILTALSSGWGSYLLLLDDLDATQAQVLALADEYRTFINERVLWIRSSQPLWSLDTGAAAEAGAWLGSPREWIDTVRTLWLSLLAHLWPLLSITAMLLLLALRGRLLQRLRVHGERAARGNNTDYSPTTLAAIDTALLAIPFPVILWLIGWGLANSPDCSDFGRSMAAGAQHSAGFLMLVRGLREVVRRGGLAELHFQWQANTLHLFRRWLVLLVVAAFPLAFALGALEYHGDDSWLGSLGRVLLLPLLLLLLVFLWAVLHPASGVLSGSGGDAPLVGRLRRLWFLLAVGTSLVLLGLAAFGYDYTALQLARRLQYTVALVLSGALVHALILRGLLLARRKLAIQQNRARMEAARAARMKAAGRDGTEPEDEDEVEVALDPGSIARQTTAMLRGALVLLVAIGAWQIWVDVLPALGILREVGIWTDNSVDPAIAITLADLLLSLLVLAATVVASRNLPGFLELAVLQRLKIAPGERHAITTLARYLLFTIGVVLAFSTVGLGWSKVQWLVAALSLGLGFGLQEIFANFVSGLILLFERPVRVGDIVVVGDLLGKVTRIKIRATTVRDLDNKELVVPNKEFVTGRFVNWTLTDSLVRMRVKVGVAYGSDTDRAKKLLVQAGRECPFAARSPNPKALFLGFGDSTLDLELRVFVEDYDQHADLLDDVHGRIDRLFKANGIEIAFPQRDLHLRSPKPLVEFLERKVAEREDAE